MSDIIMTAVHYIGGIKLLTAFSPHLNKANVAANILELETFIQQNTEFHTLLAPHII